MPTSGVIVGALVEALGLRTLPVADRARKVLTRRTARDWFQGRRVKIASVREIIEAAAAVVVAADLIPVDLAATVGPGAPATTEQMVATTLSWHAVRWDALAGELTAHDAPAEGARAAAVAHLRLAVVDLALRWAALSALAGGPAPEPQTPLWARVDGRGALLRDWLARCRPRLTRVRLGRRLSPAAQQPLRLVDRWLAKRDAVRPTTEHMEGLAAVFAELIPGADAPRRLRELRLHYALADLGDCLAAAVGRRTVIDLATKLAALAHRAREIGSDPRLPPEAQQARHRGSLALGADWEPNADVLSELLKREEVPVWRSTLRSAPRGLEGWVTRVALCAQRLAVLDEALAAFRARGLASRDVRPDAPLLVDVDVQDLPEESRRALEAAAERSPALRRRLLEQMLDEALARGDAPAANRHAAALVRLDPREPQYYFLHGRALALAGDIERALLECRIASGLRPGWDLPRAEIGVILLDAGRDADALRELERLGGEVEPMTAHFAYHLGVARWRTGDVAGALAAFERAVAANDRHAFALDMAAACALRLGDRRRAWEYAKRASFLGQSQTLRVLVDRAEGPAAAGPRRE